MPMGRDGSQSRAFSLLLSGQGEKGQLNGPVLSRKEVEVKADIKSRKVRTTMSRQTEGTVGKWRNRASSSRTSRYLGQYRSPNCLFIRSSACLVFINQDEVPDAAYANFFRVFLEIKKQQGIFSQVA